MQDCIYTSPYTSACDPLPGLQAISTMSALSVPNDEQVDQYWTEGAMNINDCNDNDGDDVIASVIFFLVMKTTINSLMMMTIINYVSFVI